jgi:transposase
MECLSRHLPQFVNHWSSDTPIRIDAQKKTIIASERNPWSRVQFALAQEDLYADDLVVLDEFGSNLNMTRRYARAERGQRALASIPRNTPANTTTISSLSADSIGPSMQFLGGMNTALFETYIEKVLGPSLRAGQIVILDNLRAHKSARVRELLAARGCTLLYLPPYSPDYSPIELAFAKIKAFLRRVAARSREALENAIDDALPLISAAEARAFFCHCGFRFRPDLAQWFCS